MQQAIEGQEVDRGTGEIALHESELPVPVHTRVIISPAEAKAAHDQYIAVCDAILTPDDYNEIQGRKRKSKSAWRKLANAFGISDDLIATHIERDGRGRPIYAAFTVRAMTRNGRQAVGYHEVHLSEKCCPTIDGDPCPRARYDNHTCCATTCAGFSHWSGAGNIPATAHTRAKNRAISDLIGAGEVSAEEMEAVGVEMERGGTGRRSSSQSRSRAPAKRAPEGTEEERAQAGLFAAAAKAWPKGSPHDAICTALNLPAIGKGALTEHWIDRGGTFAQASLACAEVRRLETKEKMTLEDAIAKVNAYDSLPQKEPAEEAADGVAARGPEEAEAPDA